MMPIYEFKCEKCGRISEKLCKIGEKIAICPQLFPTDIPGLLEKCEGDVKRIASIFCIHDRWRWVMVSEDGMAYMEDPGEPTDYLYESGDEEEFYEGPERDDSSSPLDKRFHDGIPWHQREEWYRDNYYTPDDEEYWIKEHLDEESWDDDDEDDF